MFLDIVSIPRNTTLINKNEEKEKQKIVKNRESYSTVLSTLYGGHCFSHTREAYRDPYIQTCKSTITEKQARISRGGVLVRTSVLSKRPEDTSDQLNYDHPQGELQP